MKMTALDEIPFNRKEKRFLFEVQDGENLD